MNKTFALKICGALEEIPYEAYFDKNAINRLNDKPCDGFFVCNIDPIYYDKVTLDSILNSKIFLPYHYAPIQFSDCLLIQN